MLSCNVNKLGKVMNITAPSFGLFSTHRTCHIPILAFNVEKIEKKVTNESEQSSDSSGIFSSYGICKQTSDISSDGQFSSLDDMKENEVIQQSTNLVIEKRISEPPSGYLTVSSCLFPEFTDLYANDTTTIYMRNIQVYLENVRQESVTKNHLNLKEWHFGTDPRITQFFLIHGPRISSIRLTSCIISNMEEFRDVLFNYCPVLRSLTLHVNQFQFVFQPQPILPYIQLLSFNETLERLDLSLNYSPLPVTWVEVFIRFPNLKTLIIAKFDKMKSITEMFMAIDRVQIETNKRSRIANLHMLGSIRHGVQKYPRKLISIMRKIKLPLQTWSFDFGSKTHAVVMENLIGQHYLTLEKLLIFRGGMPFNILNWEHRFERMTQLSFSETFYTNLAVLRFFPNLVFVKISNSVDRSHIIATRILERTTSQLMNGLVLPKCTSLIFDYSAPVEQTTKLFKIFPNVVNLTMVLNDHQLEVICKAWGNLRKLVVLGSMITDNGNIYLSAKLSDLWCFELMDGDHLNITDLSAVDGFLKLPKLHTLRIGSIYKLFSQEIDDQLRATFPVCEINYDRKQPKYDDEEW